MKGEVQERLGNKKKNEDREDKGRKDKGGKLIQSEEKKKERNSS